MNWKTMKAGIATLVTSMCGLPAGAVAWQDSPEAAAFRPSPRVTLSARSVVGRGQDGKRISDPDPLNNNARTATMVGARTFTLVVKVESEADSDDARIYADMVRIRLKRKSVLSALRALNLAFVSVASTVDQTLVTQGRKLSVCTTDVLMNAAENDVDDTTGASGVWDSAHITGDTLQDEAGHDVVPQPDITVTRGAG